MKRFQKWIMPIIATVLLLSYWFTQKNQVYSYPEVFEIVFDTLIKQPDLITCGPASTTMVLNCYGVNVKFDEVKDKTKTEWFYYDNKPIGMTSPEFITSTMNFFIVPAKLKRGSLDELKYFVSSNRPVIVLLRTGQTTWHYVVVVGYTKEIMIIANPFSGKIEKMNLQHFVSSWEFTTDMSGISTVIQCGLCKGSGKITDVNAGPFSSCPLCVGTGALPDILVSLLKSAGVYPKTMIVPLKSLTPASK